MSVTPSKDRKCRTVDWSAEGKGVSVPDNGQQLGASWTSPPLSPMTEKWYCLLWSTPQREIGFVAVFSTQVLTEILPGTRLFPYSGLTVLK